MVVAKKRGRTNSPQEPAPAEAAIELTAGDEAAAAAVEEGSDQKKPRYHGRLKCRWWRCTKNIKPGDTKALWSVTATHLCGAVLQEQADAAVPEHEYMHTKCKVQALRESEQWLWKREEEAAKKRRRRDTPALSAEDSKLQGQREASRARATQAATATEPTTA